MGIVQVTDFIPQVSIPASQADHNTRKRIRKSKTNSHWIHKSSKAAFSFFLICFWIFFHCVLVFVSKFLQLKKNLHSQINVMVGHEKIGRLIFLAMITTTVIRVISPSDKMSLLLDFYLSKLRTPYPHLWEYVE